MYISISRVHLTDLFSYIMKIPSTGWFGTYCTGHQSATTLKPLIFKLIKLFCYVLRNHAPTVAFVWMLL